jgi:NAD(P)H-hydrate epimerase
MLAEIRAIRLIRLVIDMDKIRLSRQQVRLIDRLSIERYHIPGVVLMENAARAVADVACDMLGNNKGANVLVVCGGGNNGGDGLAAARHLHNREMNVQIFLTSQPGTYENEAKINWEIVQAMKIPIVKSLDATEPDLVIDAIFGTGLIQPPRSGFEKIVGTVQGWKAPILAVDIPSGLDCDSGKPLGPACIVATRTVTFVAEKRGFAELGAGDYLGEVTVGDIGCPRELIEEVART